MNINQLLKGAGPQGITFEIATIGIEKDFKKKDGGTYKSCACELLTRSDNALYDVRFFKKQIDAMGLKVGGLVRGVSGDFSDPASSYPMWYKVTIGEASLNEPQPTNCSQIKAERGMAAEKTEYEMNEQKKVISMINHGFMCAAIKNGKTVEDAVKIAEDAFYAHKLLTERVFTSETFKK